MMLQGERIFLRALEPDDLEFLYQVENDVSLWEVSNTVQPYSKFLLKNYLDNAHRDIFEIKQLRLVICEQKSQRSLGLVDIYDFDPLHARAGIGIVIAASEDRGHGFAKEAIQLIKTYVFDHLKLHQIYASITVDNTKSIALFESLGFLKSGTRKDWIWVNGRFKDDYFYQLVHEQS